MKPRLLLVLVGALVVLPAWAGCGQPLAKGDFRPPYVTLSGSIVASQLAQPADVRVALLWLNEKRNVAGSSQQAVSVSAQFPVRFDIGIDALPPLEVVHAFPAGSVSPSAGVDPALRWAVGTLVVYVDGNSNGKLDVVGPTDAPSPDRVVAATDGYAILDLVSGRPAPLEFADLFPAAPGFSLVALPHRRDPTWGECDRFDAHGHFSDLCRVQTDGSPQLLDVAATNIELTLADDALLQRYACNAFWGPLEYADFDLPGSRSCDGGSCPFCRGYQCPLDLPRLASTVVSCRPDGDAYLFKECQSDAALCGTRVCHFGHGLVQAGDPRPPGWPCP